MTSAADKKKAEAREVERFELRSNNPKSWIPVRENDTLIGRIDDVRLASNAVGGDYPLLVLVNLEAGTGYDSTGELPSRLNVHAMPTVLRNEIIAQQPMPGERVQITYLGTGEKKDRGKNAAELFDVKCLDRSPEDRAAAVYGGLTRKGAQGAEPVRAPDPDADDIPFE